MLQPRLVGDAGAPEHAGGKHGDGRHLKIMAAEKQAPRLRVGRQRWAGALGGGLARDKHIAARGDGKCLDCMLLDHQYREPGSVEGKDRVEQGIGRFWRKPRSGFVE